MAYVNVSPSRTWTAEEDTLTCPQIVQIASTDTPYVAFDFKKVLHTPRQGISSAGTPIEVDSKTITLTSDTALSGDRTRVSLKVSGMAAGDYTISMPITLQGGTTNVMSRRGILRVT